MSAPPARPAPRADTYSTLKARSLARYQAAAKASSGAGGPEMTTDAIMASCLENDGYETPEVALLQLCSVCLMMSYVVVDCTRMVDLQ